MANKKDRPKYLVLEKQENMEIRQYEPRIVAETVIEGDAESALKEGFHILAAYIFGQNTTKVKIAMTAPVEQRKNSAHNWLITFSMPKKKMEELPSPKNSRIALKHVESRKIAAFVFSGTCTEKIFKQNTKLLLEFIKEHGFTPIGSCIFARYDPPWTLPCFRHNELLFEIK